MKKIRVVIAGGGFAGLSAAMHLDKTLARCGAVEVTLISRENFILFTPMLHEVAAGDLDPGDIVNPIRRIIRRIKFVEAEVQRIDLSTRRIHCVGGVARLPLEFEFDHLLLTPGSETNFFDLPGVSEWAVTMKSLSDAALLRNRVLALLEEATLQSDPAARRQLLTFVTAGGGFAGTETTGAINDFVRDTVRYYPDLNERLIRVVVIQPGDLLLPELGEELGHYAEHKLCERKVEVIKGARVASYDGSLVRLSDGQSIPASTLIWTAGVKPSAVIASLPCHKERGRLVVDEFLSVPRVCGLWAAGDCAAVPVSETGEFHPPTAQHGLRQGSHRSQEHRSCHSGPTVDALHFLNNGTTGNDRAPHRRGDGIRTKVLRFHCLVSLEGRVSDEAAAFDKEAAGHGELDTRPIFRQGDRADDHFARRRSAERAGRPASPTCSGANVIYLHTRARSGQSHSNLTYHETHTGSLAFHPHIASGLFAQARQCFPGESGSAARRADRGG
jgi:NADH:ubiquinone reductase (H+-translocating)